MKTFHESRHGIDFNKYGLRLKDIILEKKMSNVDALKSLAAAIDHW